MVLTHFAAVSELRKKSVKRDGPYTLRRCQRIAKKKSVKRDGPYTLRRCQLNLLKRDCKERSNSPVLTHFAAVS